MVYSYILYLGCAVFLAFIVLLIFRIIGFFVIVFGGRKRTSVGYFWWPSEWLIIWYHPWAIYGFGFTRKPYNKALIYTLNAGYFKVKVRIETASGRFDVSEGG